MVFRFYLLWALLTFSLTEINAQDSEKEPSQYIKKSIYFPGGSFYIDEFQIEELHNFIDSIPNLDHYDITIHSHTDNIGGKRYNQWLSEMRSESAIFELVNRHVKREAIEIKDFGQFNPLYDNNTAHGRALNRRVDIIFWPISF